MSSRRPDAPAPLPGLGRPLGLYAIGQATLLCGAWAMQVTGSMLPMALAASACLMLTVPVVRQVRRRAAARRPPGRARSL